MTLCWIILVIGLLLFFGGISCRNDDAIFFGALIVICVGLCGFLFYGNADSIREEISNVPIAEIVRTKNSIMVLPDIEDSNFIISKDYAICSAKDKDIYLVKKQYVNHYNGIINIRIEICIKKEKETQSLEKKE